MRVPRPRPRWRRAWCSRRCDRLGGVHFHTPLTLVHSACPVCLVMGRESCTCMLQSVPPRVCTRHPLYGALLMQGTCLGWRYKQGVFIQPGALQPGRKAALPTAGRGCWEGRLQDGAENRVSFHSILRYAYGLCLELGALLVGGRQPTISCPHSSGVEPPYRRPPNKPTYRNASQPIPIHCSNSFHSKRNTVLPQETADRWALRASLGVGVKFNLGKCVSKGQHGAGG